MVNADEALDLFDPAEAVFESSCECDDGFELIIQEFPTCEAINIEGSVQISEGSSEFYDSSLLSDDEDYLSLGDKDEIISLPQIGMKSAKVDIEERYDKILSVPPIVSLPDVSFSPVIPRFEPLIRSSYWPKHFSGGKRG